MPELKENPTLPEIQKYVADLEIKRGFSNQNVQVKCLLLGEEIGELFKAIRKTEGIGVDPKSIIYDIGNELADVLIYICSIANKYNINLEDSFLIKEEQNKKRKWS